MNEQEKQLLLKYLCATLPYGVKYCREYWDHERDQEMCAVGTLESIDKDGYINGTKVYTVWDIKPYLRPMSSIKEKEAENYFKNSEYESSECYEAGANCEPVTVKAACSADEACVNIDWLNAHHFDYRGLIEKGLATEAPEGMYNFFED